MIEEDKLALTRARSELVALLATELSTPDLVRIQGELTIVNAKIKALNTTEAAVKKAAADRRKCAGLAEAQSNARRAVERAQTKHGPSSAPGTPGIAGPISKHESDSFDDEDRSASSMAGSTPCSCDSTSSSPGTPAVASR